MLKTNPLIYSLVLVLVVGCSSETVEEVDTPINDFVSSPTSPSTPQASDVSISIVPLPSGIEQGAYHLSPDLIVNARDVSYVTFVDNDNSYEYVQRLESLSVPSNLGPFDTVESLSATYKAVNYTWDMQMIAKLLDSQDFNLFDDGLNGFIPTHTTSTGFTFQNINDVDQYVKNNQGSYLRASDLIYGIGSGNEMFLIYDYKDRYDIDYMFATENMLWGIADNASVLINFNFDTIFSLPAGDTIYDIQVTEFDTVYIYTNSFVYKGTNNGIDIWYDLSEAPDYYTQPVAIGGMIASDGARLYLPGGLALTTAGAEACNYLEGLENINDPDVIGFVAGAKTFGVIATNGNNIVVPFTSPSAGGQRLGYVSVQDSSNGKC